MAALTPINELNADLWDRATSIQFTSLPANNSKLEIQNPANILRVSRLQVGLTPNLKISLYIEGARSDPAALTNMKERPSPIPLLRRVTRNTEYETRPPGSRRCHHASRITPLDFGPWTLDFGLWTFPAPIVGYPHRSAAIRSYKFLPAAPPRSSLTYSLGR